MLALLSTDFFLSALTAGIALACVCGPLGCFIVWRRMSFFGDTLAHSALLGIAIGLATSSDPQFSILVSGLVLAALLAALEKRALASMDTLLGILAHSSLAVGMVFIPGGAFELGDDDPLALQFGALHVLGEDGAAAGPLQVEDEGEITVAREPGALWYSTDRNLYRGDQKGPIPATFPKGTRPFYVMKHELTQGFYAAFLNALPPSWQQRRAPLALDGQETDTCGIEQVDGRFVARDARTGDEVTVVAVAGLPDRIPSSPMKSPFTQDAM